MNTLFSPGSNVWQTRPYDRVSPQRCLAANQSIQCESGQQNLPGWCLVIFWQHIVCLSVLGATVPKEKLKASHPHGRRLCHLHLLHRRQHCSTAEWWLTPYHTACLSQDQDVR